MNPGKLNHRIRFSELTQTQNDSLGSVVTEVSVVVSDVAPTDVTWGDLRPVTSRNQLAMEAGASVLNGDKILKIRYRQYFTPTKSMLFEDVQEGEKYTIHSILPYDEKSNNDVFEDKKFIYILGIKRQ